jgi:hypothetical protein
MNKCVDSARVAHPLFQEEDGGSNPTSTLHAKDLTFEICQRSHAVQLVRLWHSRLPNCQDGPWEFAFRAHKNDVTYAVALLNSPSARCLPHHWIELRRLACSPDAPKNTPSRFMGWVARYFHKNFPEREKIISYQDESVHTGTIYRAAGWSAAHKSKPRVRDRSKARGGTSRLYRWNINGVGADSSAKIRWEKTIGTKGGQT